MQKVVSHRRASTLAQIFDLRNLCNHVEERCKRKISKTRHPLLDPYQLVPFRSELLH